LFNGGDQLPVIPLFEVVGRAFSVAPEQIAATWVKVGVINPGTELMVTGTSTEIQPVTEFLTVTI
jgi:hypothetical protein